MEYPPRTRRTGTHTVRRDRVSTASVCRAAHRVAPDSASQAMRWISRPAAGDLRRARARCRGVIAVRRVPRASRLVASSLRASRFGHSCAQRRQCRLPNIRRIRRARHAGCGRPVCDGFVHRDRWGPGLLRRQISIRACDSPGLFQPCIWLCAFRPQRATRCRVPGVSPGDAGLRDRTWPDYGAGARKSRCGSCPGVCRGR